MGRENMAGSFRPDPYKDLEKDYNEVVGNPVVEDDGEEPEIMEARAIQILNLDEDGKIIENKTLDDDNEEEQERVELLN